MIEQPIKNDGKDAGIGKEEHTKPYNQEDFEVDLCECFERNPIVCCLTCLAPCVTNYLTAENIHEKGILYCILTTFVPCIGMPMLRMKTREYYGIASKPAMDVILGTCCYNCSTCQMYNEADWRGPAGQTMQ